MYYFFKKDNLKQEIRHECISLGLNEKEIDIIVEYYSKNNKELKNYFYSPDLIVQYIIEKLYLAYP